MMLKTRRIDDLLKTMEVVKDEQEWKQVDDSLTWKRKKNQQAAGIGFSTVFFKEQGKAIVSPFF